VLVVRDLTRKGTYKNVSFEVAPRHTVAIVGSIGSGREELCRAIFGADTFQSGSMTVSGKQVRSWSMREAIANGFGYVPAERRVEGMVGGLTAAENLTLTHPGKSQAGPVLKRRARSAIAKEWFERLDIRPRSPGLRLERFSGGNQQKVVMAKWLAAENLKVLILDHPLRGLDPGAMETVAAQIRGRLRCRHRRDPARRHVGGGDRDG
jgi:ribose transport system ATP-binding protein